MEGSVSTRSLERLTYEILGAAFKVHSALGPGLLESAYESCLAYELSRKRLVLERQKNLPVLYDGIKMDCGYRIDLMVEGQVIIEVKSVKQFHKIHEAQLLTYLRLSKTPIGLLLNFNVLRLKTNGIKRLFRPGSTISSV